MATRRASRDAGDPRAVPDPLVKHRRLVLVLALVLAGGLAALRLLQVRHDSSRLTPASPNPTRSGLIDQKLLDQLSALEVQERHYDQTIWAKELLAQQYEETLVRLWNDLKERPDRFKVLNALNFDELIVGQWTEATAYPLKIEVRRQAGTETKMTAEEWRERLADWQAAGYRLAQSELRQVQFDPAVNGQPARSVVAFSANVWHPDPAYRMTVRGRLGVSWHEPLGSGQPPAVATMDATKLEWVAQEGDVVFREVVVRQVSPEPGSYFIDPLITYDLDGDGRLEIILACKNLVYRMGGDGQFAPQPLIEPAPRLIFTAVIADFDGDGNADALCVDRTGLLLARGDAQGRLAGPGRRVWSAPGQLTYPNVMAAGDVDGDVDLDIWLAQYRPFYVSGQVPTPYYDANDEYPSYLLINDGEGRFADATEGSGLAAKRFRRTYASSLVDLNDDGDLDLVVTSDFAGVDVYSNGGRGRFTDVTQSKVDQPRLFGMAHAFGDFDLDGGLDFMVMGMNLFAGPRLDHLGLGRPEYPEYQAMRAEMSYGNRMYLNREGRFLQPEWKDQVARSGWSWGVSAFDFDNDGDEDLYVANGYESLASVKDYEPQFWCHDIYVGRSTNDRLAELYFSSQASRRVGAGLSYSGYQNNHLFVNQSGQGFLEAGYLLGVSMSEDCRNVVSGDLDGDGRLDLMVTTFEIWPEVRQTLHLFRNVVAGGGNWIGFRLREHGGGFSPVGARVVIRAGGRQQVRVVTTGDSYRSQHGPTVHFGLGTLSAVDEVEIEWPVGVVQRIERPAVNQYHDFGKPRRPGG